MSYYDIDSILTDAQKLPCTFELEVPGLGILEGNAGEDIKAGTRIDLPLWLGEMLSIGARLGTARLVTLDMPDALSERVMNALKADPRTLDLRALAPHFYNLSERILELFEEEEMVDVLGDAFKKRAAEIADHAHNSRGAVGGGVDFLRGLDETERQLFRAAHDRAKDMRIWSGEAKLLRPNRESGGFLRHVNYAHSVNIMPAATMDEKSKRRSSAAGQPAPSHSQSPVHHPKAAPKRSVSSKDHPNLSRRPQHPSLSRVKGRMNMFTPPRMSPEVSWLGDQSPIHQGTRTPNRLSETPEPATPTLVNPASALLQDLLKEERAHRSSRGTISEDYKENAPQTPETTRAQEDAASEKARKVNDVFSAGQRKPKEMGMREMDQYVSKMNKLNFDLKLEVFHRTQQMAVYEKKLERMAEMEEQLAHMHDLVVEVEELRTTEKDNQILRESNEQLRIDLDKRDLAVTEAVELICQLESKLEMLENGGRASRLSMSRPMTADGSDTFAGKSRATIEIPERTSSKRNSSVLSVAQRQTSSELRKLSKAPSFLRADNKSTATLRSLYTPEEETQSRSARTELSKSESFHTTTEIMEPESPRLSVLSECSELNPFDTPTRWQEFDQLEIPLRRSSSTAGSLDSYIPPNGREESKEDQIDRWMQTREDANQTIITRRRNRASSDATKASISSFTTDLYAPKPRGRGRLDTSLFGGIKLPPTPDTMSTAYATGANRSNGSNGSITARKSPQTEQDQFFTGRRANRPRSAEEMASRCSFNDSELFDSMQTNCSNTPRLGVTADESRTILPSFNTVSSKASALLGPGSPNNPAIETFGDVYHANANEASTPTIKRVRSPHKAMTPELHTSDRDSSPPLTPQDWVAAARQGPRSRKPKPRETRHEIQQTEVSPRNAASPAAFDDDSSIASEPSEPEVPGIPTLDMTTLDILEQPLDLGQSEPKPEANPETRRRLSFIPPFFNRSATNTRRLQGSPVPNDFEDDEEDGAPSPVIPKTRTMGGASRRPMSQIITAPTDLYFSNPPIHNEEPLSAFRPRGLPQSLTMSRLADHAGSATVSGRPSTSHGIEHKRRSSLGIFGWIKSKRSDSVGVPGTDKLIDSTSKENRAPSRLAYETTNGLGIPRAETPDSMEAHVRPHSEMAVHYDDHSRRPRYMGRRARRA
ncbi:GINS complex [Penicillium concentricum]|uniref:DNA replication complex GINS protein PSF3 n=1 Tax=Penicillium concentricum TaxID=293559 RepID=A0A9W9SA32_9EURO|nr:GINS complex [Penicillium concentricum]KAJ5374857.1 GINS complex [Penicillium concentricum]